MKTSEAAKILARELRKNQTNAEKILWEKLRNRKFLGLKFTRQHPFYYFKEGRKKFFIADFFCSELKIIIELDGKIHEKQKDYDKVREELLESKEINILRFNNEELENNINGFLIKLKKSIDDKFPSLLSQRRVRDE